MNFYILQFLQNNFTKILRYKEEIRRSRTTIQRRSLGEKEGEPIGLRLKNSGRIHIKNYFPNEPG